jgi:hypothetical protein
MLGIYEVSGDTLKVSYDTQGAERPKDFKTVTDAGRVLAIFKRPKPPADEAVDITGKYEVEANDATAALQPITVTIERLGDAYSLTWGRGSSVAHVGIGLRRGSSLSVTFAAPEMLGVVVYQIEKGPRLIGDYTRLGAIGIIEKETLTFVKKGD